MGPTAAVPPGGCGATGRAAANAKMSCGRPNRHNREPLDGHVIPSRQAAEEYASVWDDIADTPREAENLRVRSELMMAIEKKITDRGWTQTQAAEALGLTQPRASDLLRGKISKFSIEALVDIGDHVDRYMKARHGEVTGTNLQGFSNAVAGLADEQLMHEAWGAAETNTRRGKSQP
ncbi:helix-turn-helix domain-containing protein [Mycobacteroides abscessus subsp. abscessus]|uniref:helix-turn-helix domain-containing protein n=1 Tax=Mycobacteroides abscessus TaxID=36809 RepID=UPI000929066E|nr:helix-turn-helix domain-containing protein [Mycobacteroides abscessus subsp. abscessus]SLL33181.1 helix-turn-helix domain-containing protein [Mycobacteroides abscessus subsp. abscessus]